MIFEAIILTQAKNSFTIRQVSNGATFHNVKLVSMLKWNPTPGDLILCQRSTTNQVYIIGPIQADYDDKYGYQLGDMTDNLTITENGTLRHTKDANETIIDGDGCRCKYDKYEIKGFGWKITGEDGKLTITMDPVGSKVIIDSPSIEMAGGNSGGIVLGNEYMQMINDIKTVLNGLITCYNSHIHPLSSGTSSATVSLQTARVTQSPEQSTKVKSG